jgi:hypothetical protein
LEDGDASMLGDGPDGLKDGVASMLGDGAPKEEGVLLTGLAISGAKITFLFIGHDHKVTLCIL